MDELLKEALKNYNIEKPEVEFIRHNENLTYKLKNTRSMQKYVLRIHKSSIDFSRNIFDENGNSMDFLEGEMETLNLIRRNTDLPVQMPVKNRDNNIVTVLKDGTLVTLLTWIDGSTVEENELTEDLAFKIGKMVGKLHSISKIRIDTDHIKRYYYDKNLLLNSIAKIKSGLDLCVITTEQFMIMENAINEILNRISELGSKGKYMGLVHSDLAKSNMIVSGDEVVPIDFSLSGYSYYYMDLGSLFSHFTEQDDRKRIIEGYASVVNETIDSRYIEAFMVFQIILFIATHIENAARFDWFNEAIERWSRQFFVPLAENTQFISLN